MKRSTKTWTKRAGLVLAVVVGYDLYKAHTPGPAPTVNRSRIA